MVRMFGCDRSFSNHIEKKKSKCDYYFNRDLTEIEISELERKVNQIIQSNLEVAEEFYSRVEAEKELNLAKLPDDAGETIRVIKIGNYDSCPCSGLHVSNTKEIGNFKIISTSFEAGVLRIRFKLIDQ
jgi:alanyl-tRNA synthetase